jgi:hypothetical protein
MIFGTKMGYFHLESKLLMGRKHIVFEKKIRKNLTFGRILSRLSRGKTSFSLHLLLQNLVVSNKVCIFAVSEQMFWLRR